MILYIEGMSGVTGGRLLAAFIDAGLPVPWLARLARRLPVPPVRLRLHRVRGRSGVALELRWPRTRRSGPRPALAIRRDLARALIPAAIKRTAMAIFRRLTWAEARVHGCPPDQVRLHQLGDPDTLVEVVGVSAALAHFRITRVVASPLLLGRRYQDHAGRWRRAVGPAVAHLTAGRPVFVSRLPMEWTTPTGAAIVTALARPGPTGWRAPARVTARGQGWAWPASRGLGPCAVLIGRPGR